jgi:hypothetical protein
VVESGRRCQRWCSEPLSSSVLHQRRLSRHHKVWDLEDIEHLRTWPALCRSAPVPTGFAATPSAPRAVLRAQGAHTPLLHTTGSSLHISIDCGSVGAGGRRKLQHGGGLCGSGAASASGAAFNWERGQSVAPLSQIENRDESRLSAYCAMPLRTAKSSYYSRWRRTGFFGAVSGLGGRLGAQARDRAFGRPRDTTRQHLSASGAG